MFDAHDRAFALFKGTCGRGIYDNMNLYTLIASLGCAFILIGAVLLGGSAMARKRIKDPNGVDKYVGSRLRMRRLMLGLSQREVADAIGLTFQQVQKYEKGTNRMGSSRLQQIADTLKVPVTYFFDGAGSAKDKRQSTIAGLRDRLPFNGRWTRAHKSVHTITNRQD